MGDWKTPDDVRYTPNDEWVRLEGDQAVAGITDYAQDQLSDLVFVELPQVGDSISQGAAFGEVESVKATSEVFMPISGQVTAVNDALEDAPEIINQDPFGKGWMIRFQPDDPSQMDGLMDAKAYDAYCDERT